MDASAVALQFSVVIVYIVILSIVMKYSIKNCFTRIVIVVLNVLELGKFECQLTFRVHHQAI